MKLVENPLLKDARRRCRKEKRKGWISGESFDDPLPECRLLKITNRGIVFLQHHPGKTPKPPTGAKGVALRDASSWSGTRMRAAMIPTILMQGFGTSGTV